MAFEPKQLDLFPTQPGVYLMKNMEGSVIYVGKAKHLKNRIKQYFSAGGDGREMIPYLIAQIDHIDTIIVPSEKEALLLENTLIKRYLPKFNALLKDDKTFVSLMINHQHQWPMIRLIRYKGKPKDKGLYFGPYTSAFAARQTLELLTELFPLRQCSDEELKRRTRPCLLYGIKKCIAPCVQKCSREEYFGFVDGTIQFLRGQNKEILKKLYKSMEQASEAMEFEKAAALLRTIRQIEHVISSKHLVVGSAANDCDALAIYRQGGEAILMQLLFREGNLVGSEHYSFSGVIENDEELLETFILQNYKEPSLFPKEILLSLPMRSSAVLAEIFNDAYQKKISILHPQKGSKKLITDLALENAQATFKQEKNHQELKEKMLLDLQETMQLNRYPKRIECFDTSNISGSDLVASMVAFTSGEYDKKRVRIFKIKGIHQSDDYAALHQVLSRRLSRAKEEDDLPDLVMVDGGKGQLNIALEVFKELDIASVDVISIAKEKGRHDKGLTEERVFIPDHKEPIVLSPRSPLLFLLQKIRDEAHRKAIGFQKIRRKKSSLASAMDALPGIGPIKRKRLLRHFGSLKRIKEASGEELAAIQGITKKDIQTILQMKD